MYEAIILARILLLLLIGLDIAVASESSSSSHNGENINNLPHYRHNFPIPIVSLCENVVNPSSGSTFRLSTTDTFHRTISIRNCEFTSSTPSPVSGVVGLTIASSLTDRYLPPTTTADSITVTNANIYIADTTVLGTFSISNNLILGSGSSLTVINMKKPLATTAQISVVIGGILSNGAEMTFLNSIFSTIFSNQTVTQCSKLYFENLALSQMNFSAGFSATSSATVAVRHSTIVTTTTDSMLFAVGFFGFFSESNFEIFNSTIIGDLRAGLTFDSSSDSPQITEDHAQGGTNNLINITANIIALRATTSSLNDNVGWTSAINTDNNNAPSSTRPPQHVMGFLGRNSPTSSSSSSTQSHLLRTGSFLSIASNTFTFPGGASNVPLIYVVSSGAVVSVDGANKGSGGLLYFTAGPRNTSEALSTGLGIASYSANGLVIPPIDEAAPQRVIGHQLILRRFINLLSISVQRGGSALGGELASNLRKPTVLIEACSLDLSSNPSPPPRTMGIFIFTQGGSWNSDNSFVEDAHVSIIDTTTMTTSGSASGGGIEIGDSNSGSGSLLTSGHKILLRGLTFSSVSLGFEKISGGMLEIRNCIISSGLTISVPIESKGTFLLIGCRLLLVGLLLTSAVTSGSLLHIEGNTIAHSSGGDALTMSTTARIANNATVSIVGNALSASAVAGKYAILLSGSMSNNANLLITNNDANSNANRGGFFYNGNFDSDTATLAMSGNQFRPSTTASGVNDPIFSVATWGNKARFIHQSSNRYYASDRAVIFGFANALGTGVQHSFYVYFHLDSSSIKSFEFRGLSNNVANNYQNSVVAVTNTQMVSTAVVTLPRTQNLNILFKDSRISSGGFTLTTTFTFNTAFMFLNGFVFGPDFTIQGDFSYLTSVVLNGLTMATQSTSGGGNGGGIVASFSSTCSSSQSCLFAVWNTNLAGKRQLLRFTGNVGDYTHIDIYRCQLHTDTSGQYHVVVFNDQQPNGYASLSVIESQMSCKDTGFLALESNKVRVLYFPDMDHRGGFEMLANGFDGDGLLLGISNTNIDFVFSFKNRIEQGRYTGAGRLSKPNTDRQQSCNYCERSGCADYNVVALPIMPCSTSTTYRRCTQSNSFTRTPYDQIYNSNAPGSCIILPDLEGRLVSTSVPSLPIIYFNERALNYATVTSGTFGTQFVSGAFSCSARRDRLAGVVTLFSYPTRIIDNFASLFGSVDECGGQPSLSFVSTSIGFSALFTNPSVFRIGRHCANSVEVSLTFTESMEITVSPTKVASSSLTFSGELTVSVLLSNTILASPSNVTHALTESKTILRTQSPTWTISDEIPATETKSFSSATTISFTLRPSPSVSISRTLSISKSDSLNISISRSALQSNSLSPRISRTSTDLLTNTDVPSKSPTVSSSLQITTTNPPRPSPTDSVTVSPTPTESFSGNGGSISATPSAPSPSRMPSLSAEQSRTKNINQTSTLAPTLTLHTTLTQSSSIRTLSVTQTAPRPMSVTVLRSESISQSSSGEGETLSGTLSDFTRSNDVTSSRGGNMSIPPTQTIQWIPKPIRASTFEGTPAKNVDAGARTVSIVTTVLFLGPVGVLELDSISSIMSMAVCSDANITVAERQEDRPYDFANNPLYLFIGKRHGAADRGALLSTIALVGLISALLVVYSYVKWRQSVTEYLKQVELYENSERENGDDNKKKKKPSRRTVNGEGDEDFFELGLIESPSASDNLNDAALPSHQSDESHSLMQPPPSPKPPSFSMFEFPSISIVPITFVIRFAVWSSSRLLAFSSDDAVDIVWSGIAILLVVAYILMMFYLLVIKFPKASPSTALMILNQEEQERLAAERSVDDNFLDDLSLSAAQKNKQKETKSIHLIRSFGVVPTASYRPWQQQIESWVSPSMAWEVVNLNIAAPSAAVTMNSTTSSDATTLSTSVESEPTTTEEELRLASVHLQNCIHFLHSFQHYQWFILFQLVTVIILKVVSAAETEDTCKIRTIIALATQLTYVCVLIALKPITTRAKQYISSCLNIALTVMAFLNMINAIFADEQILTDIVIIIALITTVISAVESAISAIRFILLRDFPVTTQSRKKKHEGIESASPNDQTASPIDMHGAGIGTSRSFAFNNLDDSDFLLEGEENGTLRPPIMAEGRGDDDGDFRLLSSMSEEDLSPASSTDGTGKGQSPLPVAQQRMIEMREFLLISPQPEPITPASTVVINKVTSSASFAIGIDPNNKSFGNPIISDWRRRGASMAVATTPSSNTPADIGCPRPTHPRASPSVGNIDDILIKVEKDDRRLFSLNAATDENDSNHSDDFVGASDLYADPYTTNHDASENTLYRTMSRDSLYFNSSNRINANNYHQRNSPNQKSATISNHNSFNNSGTIISRNNNNNNNTTISSNHFSNNSAQFSSSSTTTIQNSSQGVFESPMMVHSAPIYSNSNYQQQQQQLLLPPKRRSNSVKLAKRERINSSFSFGAFCEEGIPTAVAASTSTVASMQQHRQVNSIAFDDL